MNILGPGGHNAGSGDADYCLVCMYLLDTFLRNSEVVHIVVISALQIRKLAFTEGK